MTLVDWWRCMVISGAEPLSFLRSTYSGNNLCRYSGNNFGVLTVCVDGACSARDVNSADILGYSLLGTFQVGGLFEKDWTLRGEIDELFLCDYPLTNIEIYTHYIKYFRCVGASASGILIFLNVRCAFNL